MPGRPWDDYPVTYSSATESTSSRIASPSSSSSRVIVSGGAYGGSGIVMSAFTLSPTDLANIAAFGYSATRS